MKLEKLGPVGLEEIAARDSARAERTERAHAFENRRVEVTKG